jgi:hypothetical protein
MKSKTSVDNLTVVVKCFIVSDNTGAVSIIPENENVA